MTQQSFFAAARTVIPIRDGVGARAEPERRRSAETDPDFSLNQGKVLKQADKVSVRDGHGAEPESGCIFWIRSGLGF